jgi:hypothetical protein
LPIFRSDPREVEHSASVLLDDQRALIVGHVGKHFGGALA